MHMQEEIKQALRKLGGLFHNEGINIEVNYYFNCRENRRTFSVYIPSVGVSRDFNTLDDAVKNIIKRGGKDA
jgi:hypothetical protein